MRLIFYCNNKFFAVAVYVQPIPIPTPNFYKSGAINNKLKKSQVNGGFHVQSLVICLIKIDTFLKQNSLIDFILLATGIGLKIFLYASVIGW